MRDEFRRIGDEMERGLRSSLRKLAVRGRAERISIIQRRQAEAAAMPAGTRVAYGPSDDASYGTVEGHADDWRIRVLWDSGHTATVEGNRLRPIGNDDK